MAKLFSSFLSNRAIACGILLACTGLFLLSFILLYKEGELTPAFPTQKGSPGINGEPEDVMVGRQRFKCGHVTLSRDILPTTALASFPGSGNTWLRHVLEEATGIITGSEYMDTQLYAAGFQGEGLTNSSTIVVKTHGSDAITLDRYSQAVLLLRRPSDAILAEFNRLFGGGHYRVAANDIFEQYWNDFLAEHAKAWHDFHKHWLSYTKPLLVIQYRDMQADLTNQIVKILNFLQIKVPDDRIRCAATSSGELFKRPEELKQNISVQLFDEEKTKFLSTLYFQAKRAFTVLLQKQEALMGFEKLV